jgi:hypothetical protein
MDKILWAASCGFWVGAVFVIKVRLGTNGWGDSNDRNDGRGGMKKEDVRSKKIWFTKRILRCGI